MYLQVGQVPLALVQVAHLVHLQPLQRVHLKYAVRALQRIHIMRVRVVCIPKAKCVKFEAGGHGIPYKRGRAVEGDYLEALEVCELSHAGGEVDGVGGDAEGGETGELPYPRRYRRVALNVKAQNVVGPHQVQLREVGALGQMRESVLVRPRPIVHAPPKRIAPQLAH